MRAPAFWNRSKPTLAARALTPLSAVYAAATAWRLSKPASYASEVPVVCIGNINAGGTGKTPTVLALTMWLADRGLNPVIVSRGHGGAIEGPVVVDPLGHSAEEVGDEPLLMAAFAPVIVARNRAEGAKMADTLKPDVILLDDGHQNPAVVKTLSIVVVDADVGFGNGLVIPAGPLREPVAAGLARADAVLSIGDDRAQAQFQGTWGHSVGTVHLTAYLAPLPTGLPLQGLRVLAFAGIGRPEKFFATLRDEGAELLRTVPLGDHQPLTAALMRRLAAEADALGAQLITTEKDAVRLPKDFRLKVMTVPVRLTFDDPDALNRLLAPVLPPETAP